MKTIPLILLLPACAFACFVTRAVAGTDVIAEWTAELYTVQQTSGQDTGGRERADEILRAALIGATSGLEPNKYSGRAAETPPTGANLDVAAAQAAHAAMAVLYPAQNAALDAQLTESLAGVDDSESSIAAGKEWGNHVAQVVLAEHETSVLLNSRSFAKAVVSLAVPSLEGDIRAHAELAADGNYRFDILAGARGIRGHVDGPGAAARFDDPAGIAVDLAGNAYVSERNLCTIRKITPDGVVTTLAGATGQRGSQDGKGDAARFSHPWGVAVDSTGNVYVADNGNHTIRKIEADGTVTTLAGVPRIAGLEDGPKEIAHFVAPAYVAVDNAGNVFVTESPGTRAGRIRKIAANGEVSTLKVTFRDISLWWLQSYHESWPTQIACNGTGDLYVVYTDDAFIGDALKLTPSRSGEYQAVTMRPGRWVSGFPTGLTVDATDNLYVLYYLAVICRFAANGPVTTHFVADDMGSSGLTGLAVDQSAKLFSLPASADGTMGGTVKVGVFDPAATDIVILEQPSAFAVLRGGAAQFNVWAMGSGPLTYQWYFGSTPIPGATGAQLALRNVRDADAGAYHVMISDRANSVASSHANLDVIDAPPPSATPLPAPSPATLSPPPAPSNSTSNSSGGGSLENWFSLPVLVLLAAAVLRRRRGNAAAKTSGT